MTHKTRLQDIWSRVEALAAGLWDDNSARAVEAQAIVEEFRAEIQRFEASLTHADERTSSEHRAREEEAAFLKASFAAEAGGLKERIRVLEQMFHEKEVEAARLLATLAEHDKQAAVVHAETLKASAANETASVKKMEELYRELTQRESMLEESFRKRHDALEADMKKTRELQAARESELQARELRLVEEDGQLKKRSTDLELKSQQLQSEYRLKQQEIESIKAGLQKSIAELVKQYQSKLKAEALHAPER